ncbi:MAG: nucleotidyltransferase domain-containing protein, partial [Chloroflexota bacterium]
MAETNLRFDDPTLGEIVRRVVEVIRPAQVYLFGSRARGDASVESDYDIVALVDLPDSQTLRLQQQAYLALLGIGVAVDVLVMS